jgi:hypothetical protein
MHRPDAGRSGAVEPGLSRGLHLHRSGLDERQDRADENDAGRHRAAGPEVDGAVTSDGFGSPITIKYPDINNGDGTFLRNHTVAYEYNNLGQVGVYYTNQFLDSVPSVANSQNAIEGTAYNAAGQPYSTAKGFADFTFRGSSGMR